MSDIEFEFIGWNHSEGHDKVWTAFRVGARLYAGWGKRGKSMRFKYHPRIGDWNTIIQKKMKTYDEVDEFQLFTIFPYFKEDVSKYLTADMLSDKIM